MCLLSCIYAHAVWYLLILDAVVEACLALAMLCPSRRVIHTSHNATVKKERLQRFDMKNFVQRLQCQLGGRATLLSSFKISNVEYLRR